MHVDCLPAKTPAGDFTWRGKFMIQLFRIEFGGIVLSQVTRW